MSLEAVKLDLIQWLLTIDDEATINQLKVIKGDGRATIEEYNKDIERAEKEIAEGKFYTHEEALKRAKEW